MPTPINYVSVISDSTEMGQIISGTPSFSSTYKIGSDIEYDYGNNDIVKYTAGEYVIWNGTKFDTYGISYAIQKSEFEALLAEFKTQMDTVELQKLYDKFQNWAIRWFRGEAQVANIFIETFFGHGQNSVLANTSHVDSLLSFDKDTGDLQCDNSGVIALESEYSQFKVNLVLEFPGWQTNTTLNKFKITALTVDENNQTVRIDKELYVDTTLPNVDINFIYDLYKKKSVKFVFSMEGVETAWTLKTNLSILGYIVGHEVT